MQLAIGYGCLGPLYFAAVVSSSLIIFYSPASGRQIKQNTKYSNTKYSNKEKKNNNWILTKLHTYTVIVVAGNDIERLCLT